MPVESTVKIIVTNKSIHEETPVSISLSSDKKYSNGQVYSLYGDSAEIQNLGSVDTISDNSFEYSLKPLSVTEFIIHMEEDKSDFPTVKEEEHKSDFTIIAVIFGAAVVVIAVVLFLALRNNGKSKSKK